jgi:transcriptional regulator with XRE-family HTH domain
MDNLLNESPSLRSWRTSNGITLEELSDVTGYSVPMLSRVERGERRLSALARIRLARALGVKVRELFPADRQCEQEDAVTT